VTSQVPVLVRMDRPVRMGVGMLVGSPSQSPVQSPHRIGQPERNQQPARDLPSCRFDCLQPEDRDTERNPGEPKRDRTKNVAEAAKERDQPGLRPAPPPRTGQHDEGQVMVGPKKGMAKPYGRGRPCQQENFVCTPCASAYEDGYCAWPRLLKESKMVC